MFTDDDNPWRGQLFEEMNHLMDNAVLFGFAHTPDGRPFNALPNEEGVYVITDAQEPAHAEDSPPAALG